MTSVSHILRLRYKIHARVHSIPTEAMGYSTTERRARGYALLKTWRYGLKLAVELIFVSFLGIGKGDCSYNGRKCLLEEQESS